MEKKKQTVGPPQRKAALAILVVLTALILIGNGFTYYAFDSNSSPDLPESLPVFLIVALFVAQICFTSIWFALSPDDLGRRLTFLVCALIALLGSIYLGLLFYLPAIEPINFASEFEGFSSFGIAVPLIILFLSPLLVIRGFFKRTLGSETHRRTKKEPLTIGRMIIYTLITALTIIVIQRAKDSFGDPYFWTSVAIMSGISLFFSAAGCLPAVLLMLRTKPGFRNGALIFGAYALLLSAGVFVTVTIFNGSNSHERYGFTISVIVFAMMLISFCGALRLMGYRLNKMASKAAKLPDASGMNLLPPSK